MADDIVTISFPAVGDKLANLLPDGPGSATITGSITVDYTADKVLESSVTVNDGTIHRESFTTIEQPTSGVDPGIDELIQNKDVTIAWSGAEPTGVEVSFNDDATGGVYETIGTGPVTSVCFVSGTLIRTISGEVAVEHLKIGDLVATTSGAHRPIKWLGHRRNDLRRATSRLDALPIRIAAGAFGAAKPERDLFVSRGHAVCVSAFDEVLIPTSVLINGSTIASVDVDEVTYWHVELDSHDVLLANGLPAESYIDVGNRAFFAESETVDLTLGPDAPAKTLADYCRPFFDRGALVETVRERMRHRAMALGWSLGGDAMGGLHVVADGVRIEADVSSLSARFLVPVDAKNVQLLSDTTVPYETGIGEDRRTLGVCVGAITIDDGLSVSRKVALDDPRLDAGFHDVEEGARRWTDGRAHLSPDLWQGCRGSCFLRVDLVMASPAHWVAPATMTPTLVAADDAQRHYGRVIAAAIRDSVAASRR